MEELLDNRWLFKEVAQQWWRRKVYRKGGRKGDREREGGRKEGERKGVENGNTPMSCICTTSNEMNNF